ncbi:Lipoyltransferase 1, mitochondrial [Amphibalanus amphitrite]|uniref:Lipoyltransferase 1, mitochondrial n=1 Tax=Amphibalanus amphitrite TaxID=1232801 RepID=A0A6A4VUH2_AMPAM|nr:Lipoyltransferase 1, mitochondrial [Amphibalanus amphitrite]
MSSLLLARPSVRLPLLAAGRRALSARPAPPQPEALSVFLSQSHNVFTNLALEDWLYRNFRFGRHNLLMVWRNAPCVVIGRHQNPWREVDTHHLHAAGMPLARRNSGGGTVYHDLGNLNLTFFSAREQYDRAANLHLVADALRQGWGFDITVNERDDLLLDGAFKFCSHRVSRIEKHRGPMEDAMETEHQETTPENCEPAGQEETETENRETMPENCDPAGGEDGDITAERKALKLHRGRKAAMFTRSCNRADAQIARRASEEELKKRLETLHTTLDAFMEANEEFVEKLQDAYEVWASLSETEQRDAEIVRDKLHSAFAMGPDAAMSELYRRRLEPGSNVTVWTDASSIARGVVLADPVTDAIIEDASWLRAEAERDVHINISELDAALNGVNMALAWDFRRLTLRTDSVTVHRWLSDALSGKARLRTKGQSEMLIRRRVAVFRQLVAEYELEVTIELVGSAANRADEMTRVPNAWLQAADRPAADSPDKSPPAAVAAITSSASPGDIRAIHENIGHQGVRRTLWYARRELGVRRVTKTAVRDVVRRCQTCASIDPAPERWLGGSLETERTWDRLAMDVTHLHGHPYLTLVDCGPSRYAIWRRLRRSGALEIVQHLEDVFLERGAPAEILTDNATEFRGRAMMALTARWDVAMRFRAAYEPGGNGVVERHHRTIKVMVARQACSVAEAVHRYNVTPKDGSDPATAPINEVFRHPGRDVDVTPRGRTNGQQCDALPLKTPGVYQVSGTAAKLTRNTAYHHLTLMVNVDTDSLHRSLERPLNDVSDYVSGVIGSLPVSDHRLEEIRVLQERDDDICRVTQQTLHGWMEGPRALQDYFSHGLKSGATESVPAPVRNLADGAPSVSMDKIVAAIGQMYLKQAGKQASRGFQMVNPSDEWFPGLAALEAGLADPGWVYGKTPRFSHTFRLAACSNVEVEVQVEKGLITSVQPLPPDNSAGVSGTEWVRSILPSAFPELLASLVGEKYCADIARRTETLLLGHTGSADTCRSDRRILAM